MRKDYIHFWLKNFSRQPPDPTKRGLEIRFEVCNQFIRHQAEGTAEIEAGCGFGDRCGGDLEEAMAFLLAYLLRISFGEIEDGG